MRKWGLDYESLRAVNERIVMLHITGYRLSGPKSERPGFGTLGEAMSGFAHITGQAGAPPTLPPFMLADGVASLNAAYAVMMALYHRDVHGGPGQLIDVNLIDPLARLLEQTLLGYDQLGLVPERAGNRWDISAPRNTYRTADGKWLAMSGSSPALALRVFRAIGRHDLLDDADFSDPQRRLARAARSTPWSPIGLPPKHFRRRWSPSKRTRWPPRRSMTSATWSPTNSWRIVGCSFPSTTHNSAP